MGYLLNLLNRDIYSRHCLLRSYYCGYVSLSLTVDSLMLCVRHVVRLGAKKALWSGNKTPKLYLNNLRERKEKEA